MMPEPSGWVQRGLETLRSLDVPVIGAIAQDMATRLGGTFVAKVAAGTLATIIGASLLSVPWVAYKLYTLTDDISTVRVEIQTLANDFKADAKRDNKAIRRNREMIYDVRDKIIKLKEETK